ncbi:MAG TPA: histidine phosphatase family protein [Bacteroidia bacterium]|nr:histidine phosphatase family protein [Bacteroidia bacterium]
MKKLYTPTTTYLFLFLITLFLYSCSVSRIYVIRHAQKENTADNPHLTSDGQRRAIALCDTMLNKKISFVYSTDSNRTVETVRPTANRLGLQIKRYANDTLDKFVTHVKNISGKNILIVGHSTTVIQMLDLFGVTHSITHINDNDYDNLFVITRSKRNGTVSYSLRETTYGDPSP